MKAVKSVPNSSLREPSFSDAFDTSAIGMALVSLRGCWLKVNQSLCKIIGYSSDELLAMSFADITHPDDLAQDKDAVQQLFNNQMPTYIRQKRYIHKNGSVVWVHLSVSLLRDDLGEPVQFLSQFQEITELKNSELALKESRDLFQALSEFMPQIIWMTNAEGSSTYINQRWTEYTGGSFEQGLGAGWAAAFHPDDLNNVTEKWEHALATGNDYSMECRLKKFDGTYRWWLIRGVALKDANGKVTKWAGTCTDIHDLRIALGNTVRDSETIREQSALINEARDAIIIKDTDGIITFWNKGAEAIYGWTSGEAIGHAGTELFELDLETYHDRRMALASDGFWEGNLTQKNRAGDKITVASRWTLSRGEGGTPRSILVISSDITEELRIQTQSFRAQRMESIGTLAGGIAHDLNNVLAPIIMSIDFLKIDELDEVRLNTLDTIEACAQRGARMIGQVLSYARGVDGRRDEIQPKKLLGHIARIANETFLKAIRIETICPSDIWNIIGDETQLHQVLLNLCVNARDAMPGGGSIFLTAKNVTISGLAHGFKESLVPGNYVAIGVEDTGEGIPEAHLEKIFEPFFTTKDVGKGTGLGLSTSQSIIKSHGGAISVYSEQGNGSRFNIYLPVATLKQNVKTPATARTFARGNGEMILLVDDEPAIRHITRSTLEAFGYRVLVAESGAEAIEIYRAEHRKIALVLSDLMMPEMDGVAMIKILREFNPDLMVIVASGLSANTGVAAEKHFLHKPFTADTLLNAIKTALSEALPSLSI